MFPLLSTFISKMTEWWTRRSMAASVMAGSTNTSPHCENAVLAVMDRLRRSYRSAISSNRTDVSA